jgi:hypothetical protein
VGLDNAIVIPTKKKNENTSPQKPASAGKRQGVKKRKEKCSLRTPATDVLDGARRIIFRG